jgi:hypothetical protein
VRRIRAPILWLIAMYREVFGIQASRPGFEHQPPAGGCLAQLIQLLIRQLVQGEIIGDLHYGDFGFGGLLQQPYASEWPLRRRVALDSDRPRQTPGRNSEFRTFDLGQHGASWLNIRDA